MDVYLTEEFDRSLMDVDPEEVARKESERQKQHAEQAAIEFRTSRVAASKELVQQHLKDTAEEPRRIVPKEIEIWDEHQPSGAPWPDIGLLAAVRGGLISQLEDLYERLARGSGIQFDEVLDVVRTLERMLVDHRTSFTQLALLVERRDDYLSDHAFSACVFALATSAQLTWSIEDVRLAGAAALLHDTGMLLVADRIRRGGEQLSEADRARVQKHTAYSLSLLESVAGVPAAVKTAAYQHHERENGSGYPNQLREDDIADIARVVSIADVYAALSSPRNYRTNRLPYTAMETLVRDAGTNQFWKPAARALVQAAGLFPVGSYVKLTSGQSARVMAANPNHLDRPTIALIGDDGVPAAELVDLSILPKERIAVERPIEDPALTLQPA